MYLLIGFSLAVALLFLGLFIWAVRNGQFDDSRTPPMRMLFDSHKKHNDNKNKE